MQQSNARYNLKFGKFSIFFPFFDRLISNVWMVFGLLLFIALPLSFFAPILGLSCVVIGLFLIGVRTEIGLAKRLVLSPFVAFLGMECMGKSLAPFLLWVTGDTYSYTGVIHGQIGLILFLIPFILGYWLVLRGAPQRLPFPIRDPNFRRDTVNGLYIIALGLVLFALLSATFEIASGGIDRGGEKSIGTYGFSLRSIFKAFMRFSFMGFILLPFVIMRSSFPVKIALSVAFGIYLLLMFVSGSRGYFFFPILLSAIGYFVFARDKFLNYERLAVLVLPVFLALIVVLDFFRQTEEFNATKMTDVVGRLSALKNVTGLMEEREILGTKESPLVTIGNRLDGSGDRLIYTMTPEVFPHVGFDNFKSMLWIWVPYTLYKNRPLTAESVKIIWMYRGVKTTAHMGFTTHADLYRRFGWPGIPVGGLVFGLLFGGIVRQVLKTYLFRNATFGFLLLILIMTLFQRSGFLTVPELVWNWGYDILKYAVVLLGATFLMRNRSRGAAAYTRDEINDF